MFTHQSCKFTRSPHGPEISRAFGTERFRAVVDVKHNEAVTGESGVPAKQRDHELRCQKRSLDEFY